MPDTDPARPAPRSPADRVEAIQSDGVLSAAAKAVMIRLVLRHPGVTARDQCPGPAMMAPWLCLTERSVRRAYAELERHGWLGGAADRTAQGPVLIEGDPLTLAEHVASLEWLRDRAVAGGKIAAAVTAEIAAGRVMGFYGRRHLSAPGGRGEVAPQARVRCGGASTETADKNVRAEGPHPTRRLSPSTPPSLSGTERYGERAETGAARDETGAALAETGSTWQELARIGRGAERPRAPFSPPDQSVSGERDESAMPSAAPPPDPRPVPRPRPVPPPDRGAAHSRTEMSAPSPLRHFVPWNAGAGDPPYDPMRW